VSCRHTPSSARATATFQAGRPPSSQTASQSVRHRRLVTCRCHGADVLIAVDCLVNSDLELGQHLPAIEGGSWLPNPKSQSPRGTDPVCSRGGLEAALPCGRRWREPMARARCASRRQPSPTPAPSGRHPVRADRPSSDPTARLRDEPMLDLASNHASGVRGPSIPAKNRTAPAGAL
jgi:hypothetical protein